MPPVAWRPPGRPRWGWRGCGCGTARRCAPCAPLLAFRLPRPTSPSDTAPARREQNARRGGRGPWGGEGSELDVLERWRFGPGVEDAYGRPGEREARCCWWGEGDVDMGRRWRAWRRTGEREGR